MGLKKVISNYKEWGHKEFFKKFRSGIEGITPLQQAEISLRSTYISVLGVIAGMIVLAFKLSSMWWVEIILLGGLGFTIMQLVGFKQRVYAFKKMKESLEEIEHE